ncbi:MAG: aspartate aminotransferase family protein [Deltaproteobacteria bacterium]|nr:aspartate aminotransferase family protein [Deltaproteobacteria bacterium]
MHPTAEKLSSAEWMDRAKHVLVPNYKQAPIVAVRGEGVYVWDVEGKRYMDLIGGVAVCALGHCHPELVSVIKAQAETLWHVSNGTYIAQQIELASRLTALSGLDRAFFCNSGAEANEGLIKLTRKFMDDSGRPARHEIICFQQSFHGRTLATLTATGQPKYQKGFDPLPAGFVYADYGDLESVRRLVGPHTAAVLVEPVQGEGGVKPAPEGFLKALRALCDEHGLLLLVDEIQSGMGRTGKAFAFQHEGILPDAISSAKSLGNGFPIGAVLAREKVAATLGPGSHGSTYGGNPLGCAVANRAVELCTAPSMLEQVARLGSHLVAGLLTVQARHPAKVKEVRGKGLLVGVELAEEAAPALARIRERGLILNLAGERTLRFAPAFTVTEAQLDEAVAIVEAAL